MIKQKILAHIGSINMLTDVQQSSTELLNFYVEDLLCVAQIEKGNLKKNIEIFNTKTAVEDIKKI